MISMCAVLVGWILGLSPVADGAARAGDWPETAVSELVGKFVPLGLVGGEPPGDGRGEDEDAARIEALNQAFKKAYDSGDAEGVAGLFVERGEVVNSKGVSVRGRAEIARHFRAAFENRPGETIVLEREDLRFPTPRLAVEVGRATTRPREGGAGETSRYRAVLAKEDGQWLQVSVEEYPAAELTAHERLEELSWLIGEWVDESEEAVVETDCKWSEDGSFLIRRFTIQVGGREVMSGIQRIGWDPRSRTFHSWVFDPDGGHSEGWWTRVGERAWRIQARGVPAGGQEVSATHSVTSDRKDRIRWRSYDRSVGGEGLADLPEVVLVRKPPAPSGVELPDR